MNFLTLPPLPNSIALWGKGFDVSALSNAQWLRDSQLLYWGDLDIQGFQILSLLRRDFPTAQSLMMDRQTFELFRKFEVPGKPATLATLPHLTEWEADMADYLAIHNLRLEQEHISPQYALAYIQRFVG
jgi:hypothetical protein